MPRATVDLDELKKLRSRLAEVGANADKCCKYALYPGAGEAAAAIREGLDGLHVVSDAESIQAWRNNTPTLICATQRDCLYYALGISPMKSKHGVWSVRAGFTNQDPVKGYNTIQTRRWPNGQPQIIIAASCEHGSSAMLKQPFIRPAFERKEGEMQRLMRDAAQTWIKKTLGQE